MSALPGFFYPVLQPLSPPRPSYSTIGEEQEDARNQHALKRKLLVVRQSFAQKILALGEESR
jgi:hypothetical protein